MKKTSKNTKKMNRLTSSYKTTVHARYIERGAIIAFNDTEKKKQYRDYDWAVLGYGDGKTELIRVSKRNPDMYVGKSIFVPTQRIMSNAHLVKKYVNKRFDFNKTAAGF